MRKNSLGHEDFQANSFEAGCQIRTSALTSIFPRPLVCHFFFLQFPIFFLVTLHKPLLFFSSQLDESDLVFEDGMQGDRELLVFRKNAIIFRDFGCNSHCF